MSGCTLKTQCNEYLNLRNKILFKMHTTQRKLLNNKVLRNILAQNQIGKGDQGNKIPFSELDISELSSLSNAVDAVFHQQFSIQISGIFQRPDNSVLFPCQRFPGRGQRDCSVLKPLLHNHDELQGPRNSVNAVYNSSLGKWRSQVKLVRKISLFTKL